MIKNIFPFEDFLYILQLEEYYYDRYFKKASELLFKRGFMIHGKIVFTSRIQMTYFLSIILTIYIPLLLSFVVEIFSGINLLFYISLSIFILFSIVIIPFWVGIASILLEPFYVLIKRNLQKKASNLVDSVGCKNIMIVGSYGKTTTKNFIQQLIQYNYKSQMIAGNINTPTGIAVWLLNNLDKNIDVLVAETDGYKLGEIRDCCRIISPDYVIVTAIGDQHLERLGSREYLARTLLEAFDCSRIGAKFIMSEKTLEDFKSLGFDIESLYKKDNLIIVDDSLKTVLDGKSVVNSSNLRLALSLCKLLNIPSEYIEDTMKDLKIPDRRNQEIDMYGFKTIDSSYNISFNTAKASVMDAKEKALGMGVDLLVITGGIPELGKENASANYDYGVFLAENSIKNLIVLKTSLASDICKGFGNECIFASSMSDAWDIIQKSYNKDKVLVLMQPELNDLYYIDTNFSTMSVV